MIATLRQRGPAEWIIRTGLVITLLLIGGVAVMQTLAYAARGSDPARAHALAPSDARIAGILAERRSGPDASDADRLAAGLLAQAALRRDPTVVSAATTLGLNASFAGRVAEARRWFLYAEKLSRRDLRAQIWAIEDAVARNDVNGALHHYDIALRSSLEASALMFPVLRGAVADEGLRPALARTLATRPAWSAWFLTQIASDGPDFGAVATLFTDMKRRGFRFADDGTEATLVSRLVDLREYRRAWDYYRTMNPHVRGDTVRDGGFRQTTTHPSPFDWVLVNNGPIGAALRPDAGGYLLDYEVAPGNDGPLARQLLALSVGRYRLAGRGRDVAGPATATPYWSIACLEPAAAEIARIPLAGGAGVRPFAGSFAISAGCPFQSLTLIARPSDASESGTGAIEAISLSPLH